MRAIYIDVTLRVEVDDADTRTVSELGGAVVSAILDEEALRLALNATIEQGPEPWQVENTEGAWCRSCGERPVKTTDDVCDDPECQFEDAVGDTNMPS